LSPDKRLIQDELFGKPGASARMRARLLLLQIKKPHDAFVVEGWSLLCSASYHSGNYRQAIADCEAATVADPASDDRNTLALVQRFVNEPPPARLGGSARLGFDAEHRIPVRAGRFDGTAIADTGAQITVMMQSVAEQAGVRDLGPTGQISTTTSAVSGSIGILPGLRLGEAKLTNIPVLVLPDAQLTFENGSFKLPLVLGLYPLALFGRIAWLDHGKILVLGEDAPALSNDAVPAYWHPLGIGIPLDGPGGRMPAHFDTGSDTTYLFEQGLALVSGDERAAITQATRKLGGVGGITQESVRKLPIATLAIAGQPLVLHDVVVAAAPRTGEAARIGEDLFTKFGVCVLDFQAMKFSLNAGPP